MNVKPSHDSLDIGFSLFDDERGSSFTASPVVEHVTVHINQLDENGESLEFKVYTCFQIDHTRRSLVLNSINPQQKFGYFLVLK
jgi:hypothetical protein